MPAQSGSIKVFRPNVTRDEAIASLKTAGRRRWKWFSRTSPLRSVAELYVPFQIFRATIRHRATVEDRIMAVDLVSGSLDPFTFPEVPAEGQLVNVRTRNAPEPLLSTAQAEQALRTKLQRLLFQYGFFRVGDLKINVQPLHRLHMQYWIGFYGAGDGASIEALDATRRVKEGAKFRRTIQEWLVQHQS